MNKFNGYIIFDDVNEFNLNGQNFKCKGVTIEQTERFKKFKVEVENVQMIMEYCKSFLNDDLFTFEDTLLKLVRYTYCPNENVFTLICNNFQEIEIRGLK